MGNQVPGTKQIKYKTKSGIPISYIFYDLKGKNRFPPQPANEAQVNAMFEIVLSEIDAPAGQINEIKGFTSKYKHRFTFMHKKKIQEQNVRNSVSLMSSSSSGAFILDAHSNLEAENKSEQKKIKLEEKIKQIQVSKSSIKLSISALDKLITDQKAHYEFIQVNGINRILAVLQKEAKANLDGYKTNFSNQIDVLRFIKAFSSHHPKQFYYEIEKKQDYGNIILDVFHPICTPVSAYCLSLLEDYIWRAEDCKGIITILKEFAKKQKYPSFLSVFTEALQSSNNVLMVFYIIKFVNEVIAGTVEQEDRTILRAQLNEAKYSFVVEAIKMRLQQYFYKIDACTFINVSQQIFKYASKGKKEYQNSLNNPETIIMRNTLSMKDLEQQLVMNFLDMGTTKQSETDKENQQNEEEFMIVYLNESCNKQFNRIILDLVSQIRSYYKLETYMMSSFNEQDHTDQQKHKMVMENKLDDLKQEEYLKYIRSNCIKNDCTQEMLNIFKNLQYFQKNQVKKLNDIVLQEMGASKKGSADQVQSLKKGMKEKEDLIKKLLKQNIDLKSQVAAKAKTPEQTITTASLLPPPPSLPNLSGLSNGSGSSSLPPPPSLSSPQSKSASTSGSSMLPPPPPPPPPMPSISGLGQANESGIGLSGLPPLPPPPSLNGLLGSASSSSGGFSLPPPPPPPSLSGTGSNFALPPPPPPPSLSGTVTESSSSGGFTLPPPPPPPSLLGTEASLPGGFSLPPLPPPPSLSGDLGSLPPSPSPSGGLGLPLPPPPPSLGGGLSLPPPPSLSGLTLSSPPPPSLPGLGSPPPLGLPTLNFNMPTQKLKQKKQPKVPLKNCNYAVLSYDKIKGTIWQEIEDQKIKLDVNEIQCLFSKKIQQPKQLKTQSLIRLPSEVKKQPVKLIGNERWRNVQIVLTKLKIPKGQIVANLIACSGKHCNPSTLESIKNILPTEDEEQMVKMYSGDPNQLGRPQQFYKQLISVPEYGHRIKSMIFASIKDDLYFEIEQKIQQLLDGFTSLLGNYRFHHVLEVTLAVGNYLNGTSLKGGAWGFKIESIERLEQVKSADGKINAAYYVIKQVWKKFQYPLFSKEQLDMYSYLSKMPVSQVSSDLGELRKNLASLRKAQKSQTKDSSDCVGKFCEEMKNQLEQKIQYFAELLKKSEQAFRKCAAFYCQDPARMQSDEFGKKIFKSIHFMYESQRVYKVVQDKQKKEDERKAIKSQVKFVQKQEEPKKIEVKSTIIEKTGLPQPPKLAQKSAQTIKQQKLKQYQKAQEKLHEEMIKKRQTKVIAYRNSKAPKNLVNGMKNDFDQISFLKGIK